MEMQPKSILKSFKKFDITELYHANSVITTCQFLRKGKLISRGAIERCNLYQTPQESDDLDKRFSLWNDVFVDTVDIHSRAKKRNIYGPVTIVLDSDIVNQSNGNVWVTKSNPLYWNDHSSEDRWIASESGMESSFGKGNFSQMIVFRHCGGEISIREHIKEIIIDDPEIVISTLKLDLYSLVYGALLSACTEGGVKAKIRRRECSPDCKCKNEYSKIKKDLPDIFLPMRSVAKR